MRQPLESLLKFESYALSTLPERRQRVQNNNLNSVYVSLLRSKRAS